MSTWLAGLNPEQQQAVKHGDGPLLILAGAGSGKTTVLISRSGYLIENQFCKPYQIQVLTFTNKAATELMHRVSTRLGSQARGLRASTFHSFGLKFLRRYHKYFDYPDNFGIIDQNDAFGILRELAKSLSIPGKGKFDFEQVYKLVLEYRILGRVTSAATDEYLSLSEWIYPKYVKALKHLGVVDFEDLILKPIEILKTFPEVKKEIYQSTQFWMVDEFQDTNDLQMKLLHELVNPDSQNIAVVGDDDQAIYGFRGAMVKHILNFPKEFPGCRVIRLERNYRSTPAILNLANFVISHNNERHSKVLKPESHYAENLEPEIFVLEDELREAEFVVKEIREIQKRGTPLNEIAVLYRANSQSQFVEAELRQLQIPYKIFGGISLFDRKEIKDMAAYLRLMVKYHELSLRRVINMPPRGIGETSLDKILSFVELRNSTFLEGLRQWQEADVDSRVGIAIESFLALYDSLSNTLEEWSRLSVTPSYSDLFYDFFKKIGFIEHILNVKIQDDLQEGTFEKRLTPVRIFLDSLDRYIQKQKAQDASLSLKEIMKSYLDVFELKDEGSENSNLNSEVQMMTLHASKGLEFNCVFLLGVEEDILPHKVLGLDINEERRLFYVGITRAKKRLYLTRAQSRRRYGQKRPVAPSRFIGELPETLVKIYDQGVRPIESGKLHATIASFMKDLENKANNNKGLKL
jgi:DNA helicase-2/ATP-dependent DNA helicase PcrA